MRATEKRLTMDALMIQFLDDSEISAQLIQVVRNVFEST